MGEELSLYKEYVGLKINSTENKDVLTEKIRQVKFIPNNYQQFIANFINPNTNNNRILIKHSVGTGKTSTSIMTALNFIETYKLFDKEDSPSIFILGFSKSVFQRELLKRPEFKFVNKFDIDRIKTLQNNIQTRGTKQDQQEYQNYVSLIKRRFGNKKGYGHFKFYGYKMFFNRLFLYKPNVKIDNLTEDQFYQQVKLGNITYNMELLNSMKNGLVICDEAHNLFSSIKKNNWGIAIQLMSDYYKENIKIMYMSATILNNSSTEIVELLNLLSLDKKYKKSDLFHFYKNKITVESDESDESDSDSSSNSYESSSNSYESSSYYSKSDSSESDTSGSSSGSDSDSSETQSQKNNLLKKIKINKTKKITKVNKQYEADAEEDIIIDEEDEDTNIHLKPHAEKIIKEICKNKVSFIEDINFDYFPALTIEGEVIKDETIKNGNKNVPYLKFIRSEISGFHNNTINSDTEGKNIIYLQDFVLPNPNLDLQLEPRNKYDKIASMNIGIFDNKEVKYKIMNATTE